MEPQESNPDLESFREQWKAEVRAKQAGPGPSRSQHHQQKTAGPSASTGTNTKPGPAHRKPPQSSHKPAAQDEDEDYVSPQPFDEPATAAQDVSTLKEGLEKREPVSALEHYEQAVEKEAVGNLGDSLKLYRKAFRLDDAVHQKYKNKHFPRPPPKPAPTTAPTAAPAASAKDTSKDPAPMPTPAPTAPSTEQPLSMHDLIASFSVMSITPAPPEIEGTPPPPCPLAALPEEILVHILRDVALLDVGDYMRLAQVCKRLAYLVSTEDRIWRRICLGSEFGFSAMHYHWQKQVSWGPITQEDLIREATEAEEAAVAAAAESAASTSGNDDSSELIEPVLPIPPLTLAERSAHHASETTAATLSSYHTLYAQSWQRMFRQRPRIRFNGCYICTVNYMRSGQSSSNQVTWGSPVHIVTYYRYLRFFRDGSCLSLLTTTEPADVVHHLTREALALHAGGANAHLPSAVVQPALRGRWKLARNVDVGNSLSKLPAGPAGAGGELGEGDVAIETEGVSKYIYRLDLSLAHAGRSGGARNNKLNWKGFYSYNTLTDDWAEFTMRHNKPFFFSRVKSYGAKGA